MVLQAFIDDSRDRPGTDVLVLAGYIASSAAWEAFAVEWSELLSMPPRWDRVKMSEIARDGGDASWERIEWFYRVAEKHVAAGLAVAVDKRLLARLVEEYELPEALKNPYYTAAKCVINLAAQEHVGLGFDPTDPVDFIFDTQSESERILDAFRAGYRESVSEDVRAVTGHDPIFRPDELWQPLQAADIYAYWTRRRWQEHGTIMMPDLPFPWPVRRNYRRLVMEPDERDLRGELEKVRRVLDQLMGKTTVSVTVTFGPDGI